VVCCACAEDEGVCCILNVVWCWTQLFTVVCVDASTAFAAVYTVQWPAVYIVCVCCLCAACSYVCATRAPYFCTSTNAGHAPSAAYQPPSQPVCAVLNLPSVGSVSVYALQVRLTLAVAYVQMKIAIVVIILVILGVIIGVAVAMSKANSSK
jgi:hypothetical protein